MGKMEISNACGLQRFFSSGHAMKKYIIKKEIIIDDPAERMFSALTNSVEIPLFYPLKSVVSTWTVGNEVLYNGEVNGAPLPITVLSNN